MCGVGILNRSTNNRSNSFGEQNERYVVINVFTNSLSVYLKNIKIKNS